MKWMNDKIIVKDGVAYDGHDFSGATGILQYQGDNYNYATILDDEAIRKIHTLNTFSAREMYSYMVFKPDEIEILK